MSWIESQALEPHRAFVKLARPLGDRLGLTALPEVAHLTVLACLASFAAQKLSARVSPRLFGSYYPASRVKRDDWDLHMVGWLYAFIAEPIALHLLRHPSASLSADPLYGVALPEQRLSAIAAGYFVWDAFVTARHIGTQGVGFFLHGAVCLVAFLFTLRPFVLWCGPNFLIWELSTIFLNMHWLLDKLHMTGSIAQMINGFFLVASYVVVRLIMGTYNSIRLWKLLVPAVGDNSLNALRVRDAGSLRWLYLVLNLAANSLNFYWFRLMLLALRKRFVPATSSGTRQTEHARGKPIPVDGKIADQDKRAKGE
ncbi:hypothetical protein JCM10908_005692 [Rhodotorula pacifica]|uniref:uncharacterized protein n=1 Tax=Rhodotorula pacifica TaxID=1495444 RepID=UPI003175C97E